MSKQRILMIVALCFVLIGTVAAGIPQEPKPDSVVTCVSVDNASMAVLSRSVQVDSSDCPSVPGSCSLCIRSLENLGCEVVDLVTEFIPRDWTFLPDRIMMQTATFQLSCAGP